MDQYQARLAGKVAADIERDAQFLAWPDSTDLMEWSGDGTPITCFFGKNLRFHGDVWVNLNVDDELNALRIQRSGETQEHAHQLVLTLRSLGALEAKSRDCRSVNFLGDPTGYVETVIYGRIGRYTVGVITRSAGYDG